MISARRMLRGTVRIIIAGILSLVTSRALHVAIPGHRHDDETSRSTPRRRESPDWCGAYRCSPMSNEPKSPRASGVNCFPCAADSPSGEPGPPGPLDRSSR